MSPYHRTPFPTADGLPSRGLFCPLQDPSPAMDRLAPMSRDERPVRFRGSVSVPIRPAPASMTAAPLSELRHREASRSGVRVTPVSPSSSRSRAIRADEHSKRRTRGASRASRSSRFITDAGQPVHPLQGARRVDVTIAFDRLEQYEPDCPRAFVHRTPRLIAVVREPRGSAGWQQGG